MHTGSPGLGDPPSLPDLLAVPRAQRSIHCPAACLCQPQHPSLCHFGGGGASSDAQKTGCCPPRHPPRAGFSCRELEVD